MAFPLVFFFDPSLRPSRQQKTGPLQQGGRLTEDNNGKDDRHLMDGYPLVICHITMERSPFFMGKSTITGHFQ